LLSASSIADVNLLRRVVAIETVSATVVMSKSKSRRAVAEDLRFGDRVVHGSC
jgi:hypothetical protein